MGPCAVRVYVEGGALRQWLRQLKLRGKSAMDVHGLVSFNPTGSGVEFMLYSTPEDPLPDKATTADAIAWALKRFPRQVEAGDVLLKYHKGNMQITVETPKGLLV